MLIVRGMECGRARGRMRLRVGARNDEDKDVLTVRGMECRLADEIAGQARNDKTNGPAMTRWGRVTWSAG